MENTKKLNMRFKKEDGKIYTLSLKEVKDDIKDEDVKALMKFVIDKNVVIPKKKNVVQIKEAGIVNTNTNMLKVAE